jgi:hypothetical protein
MKGKHDKMYDMIYDVFITRCTNMYMCLNETEHIHIITTGMHKMFYMEFHARHTYMPMSLNGTKHMYIITAKLHMMIFM